MPTDPHPADVELVAQAMRDANTPEVWILGPHMVPMGYYAEAALRALAAAGRLLPADHNREWSVRYSDGYVPGTRFTEAGARQRADEYAEFRAEVVWRYVGPWLPADPHSPTTTKETT